MLSWYNVFPFVFVLIVSLNLFMVVAALPVAELQLSNHVMARGDGIVNVTGRDWSVAMANTEVDVAERGLVAASAGEEVDVEKRWCRKDCL
ncbi:hypothetical protein SCLCIDRAFT_32293 [Scleroderma citrinum Foug A]|uniref:Uncharacterized protein n=1 Tax=Scleroderma citrinum Foug A TaxID=1036808 RepID=A0A0C3D9T4_9AGAM|nr:hypothetical protein SCLCIDRAFT_32293 [Scleroderma citrinum Foug A]